MIYQTFPRNANRHALLIAGSGKLLLQDLNAVDRYLKDTAKFNPKNIRMIHCDTKPHAKDLLLQVRDFYDAIQGVPRAVSMLLYHGHGAMDTMKPHPEVEVPYDELAAEINYDGPLLAVIDSCHSGTAIGPLSRLVGCQVIASARPHETSWRTAFLPSFFHYCNDKILFNARQVGMPKYGVALGAQSQDHDPPKIEDYQHPMRRGSGLERMLFPR